MTPAALAHLHAKAFADTRGWSAQEFADLLSLPTTVLVGDPTAFILIRVTADEAEVLTLATDPAKRRQGLARKALAKGEAQAHAKGAKSVFLEVAEDNMAARALYTAAGYLQVGHRPNYYLPKNAAPVAALVLRKDLWPG